MKNFDVIVIGQGYAGLKAAGLCARKGLHTAIFESVMFGGQILNINELDPAPGDETISGVELASNLATANLDCGVTDISEAVTALAPESDGSFSITTDTQRYAARHVIIASGARFRELGIAGESAFAGRGVSHCADCDGPMFQDKEVVVVGGGDSAFQEALALSAWCRKVTILYRGDAPRARSDFVEQVRANPRLIECRLSEPVAIFGESGVEGLRFKSEGYGEQSLSCAGVFIFAGLIAETAFLPAAVQCDDAACVVTSPTCATSVTGVWAIGAVRSGFGGLLTDADEDVSRVVDAITLHDATM